MAERGMSLHVGLNRVDPGHYAGWNGTLEACENDARDMAIIAGSQGFESKILLTGAATYAAVLGGIRNAAALLHPGDSFLLTFACHGAQLTGGDPSEDDGLDETLVLFDRMLRDDELGSALRTFRPGVRVVVVSDSCHSGTVVRRRDALRFMPEDVLEKTLARHPELYARRARARALNPDVLLLSAAQDDEAAADGRVNGLFTGLLKSVWNYGAFVGDYVQFRNEIAHRMPPGQHPNLLALGSTGLATRSQRPFGIPAVPVGAVGPIASVGKGGLSIAAGGGTQGTTTFTTKQEKFMSINTMQEPSAEFDLSDNWSEVAEALRQRLGVVLPQPDSGAFRTTDHTPATDGDGKGGAVARGVVPAAVGTRESADDVTVRAFWWGFHIQIGHQALERILTAADGVNALVASIGGAIPSPAQPWIVLIAKFVVGVHALLRQLDQGNGVYISMSWFAPLAFVPTTVPNGRGSAVTSREGEEGGVATRDTEPLYEPLGLTVNESDYDVDTGLYIQPGQRVVISADGQIWAGVWATGTNGPEGWMGWNASANSPLPFRTPFALLARLDGRYFLIGRGYSFIHRGRPSKLYLRINDDKPGNGWGSFQTRVEVYAS